MNIARPANGFNVVEKPLLLKTLAELTTKFPWLQRAYSDVKEKLRMAGHRVGSHLGQDLSKRFYVDADPVTGKNRFAVSYVVLGDTLTLISMIFLVS